MVRLLVHVEGQTEETFVNDILRNHLVERGFHSVSARLLGNARQRQNRGGVKPWAVVRKEIVRHLKEDGNACATTMVDYYGMPAKGDGAWPGRARANRFVAAQDRANAVEQALARDIEETHGHEMDVERFIPFVLMHEFEALLFSDCHAFARGLGRGDLAARFQSVRDEFGDPEEINDSPLTAPSKRIVGIMQNYEKPAFGNLAAMEIGLEAIRAACPHFREWLSKLEDTVG